MKEFKQAEARAGFGGHAERRESYRQLWFGCLLIHDDATRMELDSAIAYLFGHVVVVFGAEFDIIVLHSRSQISLGGLWRESRFMVSHVTLTY